MNAKRKKASYKKLMQVHFALKALCVIFLIIIVFGLILFSAERSLSGGELSWTQEDLKVIAAMALNEQQQVALGSLFENRKAVLSVKKETLVQVVVITFLSLIGGIVGAIANHSVAINDKDKNREPFIVYKTFALAIAASFIVPLFLNIIGSNIVEQSRDNFNLYFIYFGFCILAAFYSKGFLESVADKALKTAKQAESDVESNKLAVKSQLSSMKKLLSDKNRANEKVINALRKMDNYEAEYDDKDSSFDSDTREARLLQIIDELTEALALDESARVYGIMANAHYMMYKLKQNTVPWIEKAYGFIEKAEKCPDSGPGIAILINYNKACYACLLGQTQDTVMEYLKKSISAEVIMEAKQHRYDKAVKDKDLFKVRERIVADKNGLLNKAKVL